jgi:hypothetical protein
MFQWHTSLVGYTLCIVLGFLLLALILLLNLTVTQGLINGLILYANVLWTYKDILFPPKQQGTMLACQIFVAWLNLDFGIETCLVVGLTAFWKTWLQFLFPLYIWFIAGVIIIACRYSSESRLTNLICDRAVPLLATLFLLSYTKLLRTLTLHFCNIVKTISHKVTVIQHNFTDLLKANLASSPGSLMFSMLHVWLKTRWSLQMRLKLLYISEQASAIYKIIISTGGLALANECNVGLARDWLHNIGMKSRACTIKKSFQCHQTLPHTGIWGWERDYRESGSITV